MRRAAAAPACSISTSSAPAFSPSICAGDDHRRPGRRRRAVREAGVWRTPEDPRAFVQALARTVRELRAAYPQILCEGWA